MNGDNYSARGIQSLSMIQRFIFTDSKQTLVALVITMYAPLTVQHGSYVLTNFYRVQGTTEMIAETVETVEATETGTEIEVKEDAPDLLTTVPPGATMKQTLILPAETTALANERIDTARGEMNANGTESGIPGVVTMIDHHAEIGTCSTIVEAAAVAAQVVGEIESVVEVGEKIVTNSLHRLAVARTALLPRSENPPQISPILCRYWTARGDSHNGTSNRLAMRMSRPNKPKCLACSLYPVPHASSRWTLVACRLS